MALLFGYPTSILLLFGPVLFAQDQTQDKAVEWRGPNQSVFVVTPNRYAQGTAKGVPTPRFGDLIMIEIFSSGDAGYKVGQQYTLYSGGENAGRVKIDKVAPFECNSSAAMVTVDGSFRFSKEMMALATNSGEVRTHANGKRPATDEERSTMIRLATAEFVKQGVAVASGTDIKIHDLVSTAVDRSGTTTLIGNFSIALKEARHEIFLIAGSSGVELSRYHPVTDLMDGKDSQPIRFADQLDLDSDGTDEVVLEIRGYESEEFWIYSRRNGSWDKVWVGGQGGC